MSEKHKSFEGAVIEVKPTTPQQRTECLQMISKARSALIFDQPFFGQLALRLKPVVTPWAVTAATDGDHIFVNPWWFMKLTGKQQQGLIAHEVMHPAYGHLWRRGERNPAKWNRAADYAINPIVLEAKMELPPGGCVDMQFKGMNAEHIYSQLPEQPGDHGQWVIEVSGDMSGEPNPMPQGHDPRNDVIDAKAGENASEKEAEWKVATMQAATAAKRQGKLPSDLEKMIGEVVRPRVDWRALLWRFVQNTAKNDYSWVRPSPRYTGQGFYLPVMQSEEVKPIVFIEDTSGSIGSEEMNAFHAEASAIHQTMRPERFIYLAVDAAVQRVQEFLPDEPLKLRPKGGGGTDMMAGLSWVIDNVTDAACVVILTDAYSNWQGEVPDCPVLIISTSDQTAPFGENIRMDL